MEVPAEGIEPTHPCEYWILSPARLPVPPRRLATAGASQLYFILNYLSRPSNSKANHLRKGAWLQRSFTLSTLNFSLKR